MDVIALDEAIQTLEESEATFENVSELAALYTVREHLKIPQSELDDIFPYYRKFVDIKYRYQLGKTTEGEVIQGMKNVCQELQEFIEELYSHTDMNKERLCIKGMLKNLSKKFS